MVNFNKERRKLCRKLQSIQGDAINKGLALALLKRFEYVCNYKNDLTSYNIHQRLIISAVTVFIMIILVAFAVQNMLSARCLLSSNYFVWEATRPLADCNYCMNLTKPVILSNITRREFMDYAYSSKPMIIKKAISHWRAVKEFTYYTFKRLYEKTPGSYESLEYGCQFLNFKSDLFTLKDVFNMPKARVKNEPGQDPWYVGWGNCHPEILAKVRQYYSIPDFLPEDAEFPATENIFLGYEIGAVMHLDYIPRLMWQGQVKGNKTWFIAPVPECENVCSKFEYYVEPGDIVFLDTRLWYHATSIPKGQLSVTVQSEYG